MAKKIRMKTHQYKTIVEWNGDQDIGTTNYRSYQRDYLISSEGKYAVILGSADPSFLGDKSRYNPEDLLVSSISACHMLWYLHLCAVNKVVVTNYTDNATGVMEESKDGSGKFKQVTLNPIVTVKRGAMTKRAYELHAEANKMCFIANSCNFDIEHCPQVKLSTV